LSINSFSESAANDLGRLPTQCGIRQVIGPLLGDARRDFFRIFQVRGRREFRRQRQ